MKVYVATQEDERVYAATQVSVEDVVIVIPRTADTTEITADDINLTADAE